MITTINRTGVSPFSYHEGMQLQKEPGNPNVTLEYFKKSMANGSINDFKYRMLVFVYRYSYLNRNMLGRLMKEDEKKLSAGISFLVKHGFLTRYYCTYGSRFTPYFYGVGSGVETYMYRIRMETTPHLRDAASAIHILSRNQFMCAQKESSRFIEDCLHTKIPVNGGKRELDIGYSAMLRSTTASRIRVVCVPVRRGEDYKTVSTRIKLAMCRKEEHGIAMPICVCEDVIHISELGSHMKHDEVLNGDMVLFCTDLATFSGEINDNLLGWDLTDPDGSIEEIALK